VNPDAAVEEIVRIIRDRYKPEKIILFGSRVWGEPDEQSDLDILVIKETSKPEIERMRDVSRLVRRYHHAPYWLAMDILVKTPAEVRHRLEIGDDFIRQIVEHGKVVYERAMV